MNHLYQLIRGSKSFVIHEYLYGVRSTNSLVYPLEDLSQHMRKIPPHFQALATIHCTDKAVRDASDYKNKVA